MTRFLFAAAAMFATSAIATPPPPSSTERAVDYSRSVDAARMKATVEKLVSFGTRHTLSSQTDPKRGIGAAWTYAEQEFRKAGLEPIRVCEDVTGARIPHPVKVCNIVAIQRGTQRPNDVVVITGHIDSRVTDVMNARDDAPGANDDGSGTAAVIEAARVLSKRKFPGTIVYGVLTGEEQGLFGGKILANYATAQKWNVIANLNNDIVGNSCGSDGLCDADHVRVFSEGPRWQGHDDLAAQIRSKGGENDSPSRNLSRYLATLASAMPDNDLEVRQIWRNDRFGRGGDHTEFLNAGFPAVRLSVAVENYDQQHQDLRPGYGDTVEAMDFAYLRKVTRLNVAALAAIASAPRPPEPVAEGAVQTRTTVTWKAVPGATDYVIRWRRTDANQWQEMRKLSLSHSRLCEGTCGPIATSTDFTFELPGIRVDDWVFGISSVAKDGAESPVASAVPGGAYRPYLEPAPKP